MSPVFPILFHAISMRVIFYILFGITIDKTDSFILFLGWLGLIKSYYSIALSLTFLRPLFSSNWSSSFILDKIFILITDVDHKSIINCLINESFLKNPIRKIILIENWIFLRVHIGRIIFWLGDFHPTKKKKKSSTNMNIPIRYLILHNVLLLYLSSNGFPEMFLF